MKVKFLFVGVTQHSDIKSIYWNEIAKNYKDNIAGKLVEVDTRFILNNTKGLGTVYNQILLENRSNYDYIVFIHADTLFSNFRAFLAEVLFSKGDIMGLAGATAFPYYGKSPIAWNTNGGNAQAGEVWHKINSEYPIVKNLYANTPKADNATTVDGVCLIFSKNALNDLNLVFDERFTFDFYDMDLCFTATKLGKKISIIHAPVIHYSTGSGILNDRYKQLEVIFREKWNIPNEITSYTYDKWVSLMMTNS